MKSYIKAKADDIERLQEDGRVAIVFCGENGDEVWGNLVKLVPATCSDVAQAIENESDHFPTDVWEWFLERPSTAASLEFFAV